MIPSLSQQTIFAKDFRVIGPLGQGGMGSVYLVEQISTGSQRALKLMHQDLANDSRFRQRFVQEAKVASRIDSEHIVQVVAAGIDELTGMPWLAMELLKGQTLAEAVRRRGACTPIVAWEIFTQVCHALRAAHQADVVHRDLKPDNIFLTEAKREGGSLFVKVLDFGIARVAAEARTTGTASLGTPLWMAPEQGMPGSQVGPQADIWALGLLGFYLLVGKEYWMSPASTSFNPVMVANEILHQPLIPATARAAQLGHANALPEGFDAWFSKCVQRDLRERARSVESVRDQLGGILQPWLGAAAERSDRRSSFSPLLEPNPSTSSHSHEQKSTVVASHPLFPTPKPVQTIVDFPTASAVTAHDRVAITPVTTTPQSQIPANSLSWTPPMASSNPSRMTTPPNGPPPTTNSSQRAPKPSPVPLFIAMGVASLLMITTAAWALKKYRTHTAIVDCSDVNLSVKTKLERCQVACEDEGEGQSCINLGQTHLRAGAEDNMKSAIATYRALCDKEDQSGCARAGLLLGYGPQGIEKDTKKAAELLRNACGNHSSLGCTYLAVANELGWDPGGLTEATTLYNRACTAGEPIACVYLASMRQSGRGIAKDVPQAAELREKARIPLSAGCKDGEGAQCAALGYIFEASDPIDLKGATEAYQSACELADPVGCNNLGRLKLAGLAAAADPANALALFQKACALGEPTGCNNIAAVYSGYQTVVRYGPRAAAILKLRCGEALVRGCAGWGPPLTPWMDGPRDRKKSATLFEQACNSGLLTACVNFGGMLFIGQGIEKNRAKAHQLFNSACEKGDPGGCGESATVHSADHAESTKKPDIAATLMKKACDGGELDACVIMADYTAEGFGMPKDNEAGFTIAKNICTQAKEPMACEMLGRFYHEGIGTEKSEEKAINLWESACGNGPSGCYELAAHHLKKPRVTRDDFEKAISLLGNGCGKWDLKACYHLGVIRNEQKNHAEAIKLWEKGCDVGDAISCHGLARAYLLGQGIPKNEAMSFQLDSEACDDGYASACIGLGMCYARGTGVAKNLEKAKALLQKFCEDKSREACNELDRIRKEEQ